MAPACHPHPDAVDVTAFEDPDGPRTMLCPECDATYLVQPKK